MKKISLFIFCGLISFSLGALAQSNAAICYKSGPFQKVKDYLCCKRSDWETLHWYFGNGSCSDINAEMSFDCDLNTPIYGGELSIQDDCKKAGGDVVE